MPLYEYQCDSCGARFELIRKFSDPPLEACPTCQGGPVRKLVSSPAFQFKGSGWYVTDYARKGGGEAKAKAKDKDTEAAPAAPASDSGSKETKTPSAEKAPAPPPAPSTEKK